MIGLVPLAALGGCGQGAARIDGNDPDNCDLLSQRLPAHALPPECRDGGMSSDPDPRTV
ncbi:hypothetical protein [Salipiger abyssi]|uniref:hypothetical protein n=1 Tax=Salipiger abyssi TaxID=1250539 RepID=UPI004059A5CA